MRIRDTRLARVGVGLMLTASFNAVHACSVCYGKSDSVLAKGLHWGVISLLAVVLSVLGGIAAFFIYLAKRSAAVAGGAMPVSESAAETTDKKR